MCTGKFSETDITILHYESGWRVLYVCVEVKAAEQVWRCLLSFKVQNVFARSDSCSTQALFYLFLFLGFFTNARRQMLHVSNFICVGCEISQDPANMQSFAKVTSQACSQPAFWSCDRESSWAHSVHWSRGMWVYLGRGLYLTNLQSSSDCKCL